MIVSFLEHGGGGCQGEEEGGGDTVDSDLGFRHKAEET